jgi:hypothetical protein
MSSKNCQNLVIFFLVLHLAESLKVNDLCMRKQKECRGLHDRLNYKIECNLTKCHGSFHNQCGNSNICSRYRTNCDEYDQLESLMKIFHRIRDNYSQKSEIKKKFNLFNKNIKECKLKTYEFNSNGFCVNGIKCWAIVRHGHLKTIKKSDCKCPIKLSFRCDEYCAVNSIACDYFKSNKNKKKFKKINNCGNNQETYNFESYISIF